MGKKSTPKAPDYAAAAEETAKSSRDVTEQQTWANRANQYTPYGSQTWSNQMVWDPATEQYLNQWSQNTNLDPTLQAALDEQMATQYERSALAGDLTGRLRDEYGKAMDWSNLPGMAGSITPNQLKQGYDKAGPELDPANRYYQQAGDAIYNQWADRAAPQQQAAEQSLRARLSNQGLREGDAAYDNELAKLRMSQGDQQRQAAFQATAGAGQEAQRYLGMDASTRQQLTGENAQLAQFYNQAMQGQFGQQLQANQYQNQLSAQALAQQAQQRGWGLNEINALLSGQQVNMPNMPQYNQAAAAQNVDYTGAARDQYSAGMDAYNAQAQQSQALMSGITGMAGSFAGLCDRRLKRNISKVGEVRGVNLYTWIYLWGEPGFGVMADEVPHAIAGQVGGYDVVDYGRVW